MINLKDTQVELTKHGKMIGFGGIGKKKSQNYPSVFTSADYIVNNNILLRYKTEGTHFNGSGGRGGKLGKRKWETDRTP